MFRISFSYKTIACFNAICMLEAELELYIYGRSRFITGM